MYGFDVTRITAAVVRVLNCNYDYVAAVNRYFKSLDIESIETWYIGIRVKLVKGVFPGRRFIMLSKSAVCAKLAPSPEETVFVRDGKQVSDRLHLSTYRYKWDDSGEEHTWTTTVGYETKKQAHAMQHWLWQNNYCAHSEVRKSKRTSCDWELKIWGISPSLLTNLIAHYGNRLIKVIKPNGSYRFMLGEQMLTSVYTKNELKAEAERFIKRGYLVECIDPNNGQVYKCNFVDSQVKFSLVCG